ncbi:MAG: cation:proton antiporter [Gammaproteobacteria bacterium]
MNAALWFLVAGALLIFAVVTRSLAQRMWFSSAMFYLGAGLAIGPAGFGVTGMDAVKDSWFLERLTEIAVILSLFTTGLKLSPALADRRWWIPLRLAFGAMALTVGLLALAGVVLFDLSWGAAILLGAMLAPTDPVLASDVQVTDAGDRDRLRFSLTGEAGLNDGAAFPFVMLGLGLLGLHEIGAWGWRWLAIDVVWATLGGLAIGGLLGMGVGRLVLYLRTHHQEALGSDEFLAVGLIALAYGLALTVQAYGFLAVFAAGVALRCIERVAADEAPASAMPVDITGMGTPSEALATDPQHAPAYLAESVLAFNEKAEHIGEFVVLLFVGMIMAPYLLAPSQWGIIALLFLVIRPLAVAVNLLGSRANRIQRILIAWFGIRGLGSVYYLAYVIQHGLPDLIAEPLAEVVLTAVAVSVIIHGISVVPLMRGYEEYTAKRRASR